MIIDIFAMHDRLNGFMNVFPEANVDMAKRGFLHGLASAPPESMFYSNPSDYSLYHLGTFDTDSGTITPFPVPEFVIGGQKREDRNN